MDTHHFGWRASDNVYYEDTRGVFRQLVTSEEDGHLGEADKAAEWNLHIHPPRSCLTSVDSQLVGNA